MTAWPFVAGAGVTDHPALGQLVEQLQGRFQHGVVAVLLYGSCLRSGDPFDGLVDLYLICERYRNVHGAWRSVIANRCLPPNVYYAETRFEGKTLRAKVALVALDQFRRGCGAGWFQCYFSGRFAQPVALHYARDAGIEAVLRTALCTAQVTLLQRSLPLQPRTGSIAGLWSRALSLSYGTELRTERAGRAAQLVAFSPGFYARAAALAAEQLPGLEVDADCYTRPAMPVWPARLVWSLRRLQGKLLSLARLVKALFTFDGGLDYLAWKLERHSGQPIDLPERVRRYPLLFAWGFFWRLYRRRVFR